MGSVLALWVGHDKHNIRIASRLHRPGYHILENTGIHVLGACVLRHSTGRVVAGSLGLRCCAYRMSI